MANSIRIIIAAVLALAMVLSLAACGGGSGSGSGTGNSGGGGVSSADAFDTDAFIASMPANLRGTTIDFLNWYDPMDRAHEKAVIEAFEATTGIDVNIIYAEYGTAYSDKLAGLVATGDAPDTFRMSVPKSVQMKSLQPIVNTGYDFSGPEWNNDVKEAYSVNGVQYAANLSYTPFTLFTTLSYHPKTMEEFGFEDPWELYQKGEWTWDKINEMCEEWIKQGPDYYGIGTVTYDMIPATAGLDFVSYDGSKWNMNLYDSELLDMWKETLEGREQRLYVQSTNTTFNVTKHKSLFSYYDSTQLEASSTYCDRIKKYGDWAAVPFPKHADKDYYAYVTEQIGFGVPIGAENPEAVPYFISWYSNLAKYDLDTMFYNEHAKAVYEALVSEPNRYLSMASSILAFDTNPFIWHLFNNGASSQVTTFIQGQEYKCKDKLSQWNEVLGHMNTEIKK